MNKALPISKEIFNKPYIFIVGCMLIALSGCGNIPSDERSPKSKINIPETPPLVAGISVSKSLYQKKYPNQEFTNQITQQRKKTLSSILTNDISTDKDTPEATLKKALDTIYFGKAREAAQYYQTNIPNLALELEKTQKIFQKNIENITIKDIKINEKEDEAILHCELKMRNEDSLQASNFLLKKVAGKWLIIG